VHLRADAICGLLAPITFIAGWLIGGLAQPAEYSVVDHDVSDLGALTAGKPWLYNQLGSNLTGLLLFVLALGLWKTVGTSRSARIGVIAFGVFAVGTFLDGLFRLDCRKIDEGCDRTSSWHAAAHLVGPVLQFSESSSRCSRCVGVQEVHPLARSLDRKSCLRVSGARLTRPFQPARRRARG